jgi:NNP family nitrate/nitrite transporter-like MFS transporter
MEVTSRGDFVLYCLVQAPLILTLAVLAWQLGPSGLNMISAPVADTVYVTLALIYAFQIFDTWRINAAVMRGERVPEIHRYEFRQVAVLCVAYFVTFGSELAVVSILPLFFKDTFGLSLAVAGFVGASFGSTTFFARPSGGWLSDRFGRRRVLVLCMLGTALGYGAMSLMGQASGVAFGVAATVGCSLFVNAGNGAIYAMLPMIKRRLTGQIAGLVGAFGNVGGVLFLTLYSQVPAQTFFAVAAGTALIGFALICSFVKDPKGQISEIMPDGTVTMIDVA